MLTVLCRISADFRHFRPLLGPSHKIYKNENEKRKYRNENETKTKIHAKTGNKRKRKYNSVNENEDENRIQNEINTGMIIMMAL